MHSETQLYSVTEKLVEETNYATTAVLLLLLLLLPLLPVTLYSIERASLPGLLTTVLFLLSVLRQNQLARGIHTIRKA